MSKKESANMGDVNDNYDLGIESLKSHQWQEAERYFTKAAKKGHANSMYELALLYHDNPYIPFYKEGFEKWIKEATRLGHELATERLRKYEEGTPVIRQLSLFPEERQLMELQISAIKKANNRTISELDALLDKVKEKSEVIYGNIDEVARETVADMSHLLDELRKKSKSLYSNVGNEADKAASDLNEKLQRASKKIEVIENKIQKTGQTSIKDLDKLLQKIKDKSKTLHEAIDNDKLRKFDNTIRYTWAILGFLGILNVGVIAYLFYDTEIDLSRTEFATYELYAEYAGIRRSTYDQHNSSIRSFERRHNAENPQDQINCYRDESEIEEATLTNNKLIRVHKKCFDEIIKPAIDTQESEKLLEFLFGNDEEAKEKFRKSISPEQN